MGASEGGPITALAVEQRPDVFDGGVAACGPVGDFHRQTNYWGDVRVLFDCFFRDVEENPLPPFTPAALLAPQEVIDNWYRCDDLDRNENYPCTEIGSPYYPGYQTLVAGALASNPEQTEQLLKVASVPVNTDTPKQTSRPWCRPCGTASSPSAMLWRTWTVSPTTTSIAGTRARTTSGR